MRNLISPVHNAQRHLDKIAAHAKMVDFQARHTRIEPRHLVFCPASGTFSKAYTITQAQRMGLPSAEERLAEVVVSVLTHR